MKLPPGFPRVANIPAGAGFADALAAGVLARWGDDSAALPDIILLLPNRRGVRAVRDAFLRLTDGRPLLLPRMAPLGDVDADELAFSGDLNFEGPEGLGGAADFPPDAISGMERQFLLARLIRQAPDMAATPAQATRLAAELARLIDAAHAERLDFARLEGLAPEDYADHWRLTLDFLKIVTEHWPAILAARGRLDPAARRNAVLAAQTAAWERDPPTRPVIAAGSTGSLPAAADLMATVSRLPQGVVVLPGLDAEMDADTWEAVKQDDAHPQYGLSRLLARLGVERADVFDWTAAPEPRAARRRLISEAQRPAATAERWRELPAELAAGFAGLIRIDTETVEEEAAVAALLLREALETEGRTAALVTPDRNVARRTQAQLRRWGVEVDDSAGEPLSGSPRGAFFRLVLRVAADDAHPLALLALAKHPLTAAGTSSAECRGLARAVERAVLRGPRLGGGLRGLRDGLAAVEDRAFDHPEQRAPLLAWAERMEAAFIPLTEAMLERETTLDHLLRAHVATAECLAAGADPAAPTRLWRMHDGEALANFIHDLLQHADRFGPVEPIDYPPLFDALLLGATVRPQRGSHPRLAILGPMEARLAQADRMVLAGVNEGMWPPEPAADPWMSRPMRAKFGLPSPERRTGLSAHDFAQAMGADEVFIVRAQKADGAPTQPSRWLQRLDAVARALNCENWSVSVAKRYLDWARQLDKAGAVAPVAPPQPRPPVEARPRKLSVTAIETWMRNPYAIYARHILKLEPLEPVAADPGAAERGQAMHAALDAFVRAYPDRLPADAEAVLRRYGDDAFAPLLKLKPEAWAFWKPRFDRVAGWFVAAERTRRPPAKALATETPGRAVLAAAAGDFVLTAKADRIDLLGDGRLCIIDYKTGTIPTEAAVALGFAPQLPLEAAIARQGGFSGVDAKAVGDIQWWKLSGGAVAGEIKSPKSQTAEELADAAWVGLSRLVDAFDKPETAYVCRPRPEWAPRFDDYAHLARVAEWSAAEGEDEE